MLCGQYSLPDNLSLPCTSTLIRPLKKKRKVFFHVFRILVEAQKEGNSPPWGCVQTQTRARTHTRSLSCNGVKQNSSFYINSFYLNCPYVASGFRFSLRTLYIVCSFGLSSCVCSYKICQFERFCLCSSHVLPEGLRAAHSSLVQYNFITILYLRLGLWPLKKEKLISRKVQCINNPSFIAVFWWMLWPCTSIENRNKNIAPLINVDKRRL